MILGELVSSRNPLARLGIRTQSLAPVSRPAVSVASFDAMKMKLIVATWIY